MSSSKFKNRKAEKEIPANSSGHPSLAQCRPIKCECGKMMHPFETDGKITWICEDDTCGDAQDSLGNFWNVYG